MKKSTRGCKVFSVAFISLVLLLISCRKNSGQPTESTTIDLSAYSTQSIESAIESVSAVDFKIDDSWIYLNTSLMTKTENSYAFLDEENGVLQIYDMDGHKKMSRSLFGRGPGEISNNIGAFFALNKDFYVNDAGFGVLMRYDENGKFISKWNSEDNIMDDYLYCIDRNKYVGLSTNRYNDSDEYVYVYDKDGKTIYTYLQLPHYLFDKRIRFGKNSNSYIYKDTVRFILPYDYNIYSVTENSLSVTYQFIPENPIPPSVLENSEDDFQPKTLSKLMSGGYDFGFRNIFETDSYLFFDYSSKQSMKKCMFDKRSRTLRVMPYPDKFYNKGMAENMSVDDVWQYLLYYISPIYCDGEFIYGRIYINTYEMLKDCSDKLDDRLLSLKNNLEDYIKANDITVGDAIILKIALSR